jgi:ABC-2 type transport system permease protein
MKWHRIKALLLHSWYHFFHSKETQIDLFWFTYIQFLIFGLISKILSTSQPEMASVLMLGFLLWEIVRIGQYSVTISMLWEVWSKSFNSMFISPLSMTEWLVSQMISSVFKIFAVISGLTILAMLFFNFSLFSLGWMLLIYIPVLVGFSYASGILITALIIRYGTNIQSFAWGLIYMFQPISAVFYPLEALPIQIRWLGYLSPITYVAEAARAQLATGTILWSWVGMGVVMCAAYLILSLLFLKKMYQRSRATGEFARLGN